MDINGSPAPDLFAGIDDLIKNRLGVTKHYRTITAARELADKTSTINGEEFVNALFDGLRNYWLRAPPAAKASKENFRWRVPKCDYDKGENKSPETILERKLMCACEKAGRDTWSNQVPVLSGRRAVDLVNKISGGFEFIELKVESNTPLHAAIEILINGIFWLLARQDRTHPNYPDNPILNSSTLCLSTLAPEIFYTNLPSSSFASALNSGVSALGERHDVVMRFQQMKFPEGVLWRAVVNDEVNDKELLNWLDSRKLVEPCA
jgi:hypothetical protein